MNCMHKVSKDEAVLLLLSEPLRLATVLDELCILSRLVPYRFYRLQCLQNYFRSTQHVQAGFAEFSDGISIHLVVSTPVSLGSHPLLQNRLILVYLFVNFIPPFKRKKRAHDESYKF